MTNQNKTTLYIGVTSNLSARIRQHKDCKYPKSFTARYNLHYCIYYETFSSITEAIAREKQLKKWSRIKKEILITSFNPDWQDLSEDIFQW